MQLHARIMQKKCRNATLSQVADTVGTCSRDTGPSTESGAETITLTMRESRARIRQVFCARSLWCAGDPHPG